MDSVRAIPLIRGRNPAAESDAGSLQIVSASPVQSSSVVAQPGSGLPVKLLAVALLAEVFADAPSDYPYLRLVPRLVFIGILLAAVFIRSSVPDHSRRVSRSTSVFMVLFGIVCTISWISGGNDFGAVVPYRWLITLYNLIFFPYVTYFLVKKTRYDRGALLSLLKFIAIIGVYLLINGYFEHYRIGSLVFPKYIMDPRHGDQGTRLQGPFGNSNHMGHWMMLTFVALSLLGQVRKRPVGPLSHFFKLMIVGAVYLTETRAIWLEFAGILIVTLGWGGQRYRKQSIAVLVMIAIGFVLGVGSKFSLEGGTLFSKRSQTVDYRNVNMNVAYRIGMNNFFFGAGYGSFAKLWRSYFQAGDSALVRDLTSGNESTYYGLFAETGIIGLLLYLSMLGCLFKSLISIWKRLSPAMDFEKDFVLTSAAFLLMAVIHGWFGDLRFSLATNTMVFMCAGISTSIGEANVADPGSEPLIPEPRSFRMG
jgi:hypothetical protein